MEEKYGEVEEMNVCDNLGDHLVGNVYVKVDLKMCLLMFFVTFSWIKGPLYRTFNFSISYGTVTACVQIRLGNVKPFILFYCLNSFGGKRMLKRLYWTWIIAGLMASRYMQSFLQLQTSEKPAADNMKWGQCLTKHFTIIRHFLRHDWLNLFKTVCVCWGVGCLY